MRINGHGHLLPYPDQIPSFMKEEEIFWLDNDRSYMRQKNWKRPITDPSFFLEEKLEWMERNKIDHEVILNLSQLYCNGMERKVANKVIRFQNNFNAEVQTKHPKKFTCGFVIQPACIDSALEEMKRCVEELGLQLMCLPTHFLNDSQKWESTASPSAEAIFEQADAYNLAIEIHPYDAPKMVALADESWRFHLVWMLAQTADTYHIFTLRGLQNKFPEMRVCFAHGNQFGQINTGRRKQGFLGRPDLFKQKDNPDLALGHSHIFFDTLVHDVDSLELLIKRQGIAQVVAGLDDPYPLGEMESVPGSYPGKLIDDAVERSIISEAQRDNIWFDNVVHWLCGHDNDQFLKRIGAE